MTTTVTTHSTSVGVSMIGTLSSLPAETLVDSASMSPQASMSLPSSPTSVTSMSGLLNSRNLVQDEKLVVATLATLDSGSASNLIKQDLKWIIQSRRKAEGKSELQVEFKKPVKDEQLTSEELIKRARRRELNRLAARRSREKGQRRKDMLVEEIRKLQSQNSELINILGDLTEQRNSIVDTLRQHMKQCSDYHATQSAAVGMSQRVLDLLGFSSLSSAAAAKQTEVPGVSGLYISTTDQPATPPRSQSPYLPVKKENFGFSSCPSSPSVVGLSGKLIKVEDSPTVLSCQAEEPFSSFSGSSMYNVGCPVPGSSKPLASPQFPSFESPSQPPPRLVLPPRRSSTQGLDVSLTAPSTPEPQFDEEVVHYKHKLMKHRMQQSMDVTKPSSASARAARVSLERSFSFPCTVRESRNSITPTSPDSYTIDLTQSDGSSSFQASEISMPSALDPGGEAEDRSSPLNLALKGKGKSYTDSEDEKQFGICPMDTWPPAGARSGISTRGLERRWSVDDHNSLPQPVPEPLNLSSKSSLEDEGISLSQTSTSSTGSASPSRSTRISSKYSRYAVDPYS